jgi:bifunctional non-homologous end joining protein LigD
MAVARHRRKRKAQAPAPRAAKEHREKFKIPAGARKADMPEAITPALATLSDRIFAGPGWLFEIKWDGVRALARVKDKQVALWSRAHREITQEYPELGVLADRLAGHEVWLDGEVVALDREGRSDFQLLQRRMSIRRPSFDLMQKVPVSYYVFDILYCDGYDLREVPLLERKTFLHGILQIDSVIRYSDHQIEKGRELYDLAASRHLEGILGKQIASSYPKGRTTAWLKFKLNLELDAVVGGWTDPRGSREHFGALLLGLYEGSSLKYIGSVGAGFSGELQGRLMAKLKALKTDACPFDIPPATREKSYWIRPHLVARVKYGSLTEARRLRAPRFVGIREDVGPRTCAFGEQIKGRAAEENPARKLPAPAPIAAILSKSHSQSNSQPHPSPKKAPTATTFSKLPLPSSLTSESQIRKELERGTREDIFAVIDGRTLHLTHLNKIYFPADGYTKRNLLAYYYRIGPLLLPFLKDRPLVLRRYPDGIEGQAFFQKDAGKGVPEWMRTVAIASEAKGTSIRYFIANDLASLLYLVNLGCIDQNPWSSRYDDVEHPDYMFFDLDPTEGTTFATVVKLAKIIVTKLQKIGLDFFLKTSGATGCHIFIPIERIYTYEQVRQFVQTIALLISREYPDLITSERSVRKRPRGRIYIDAHQNSEAQSLASVYSIRAFPGAPVSAPVTAQELTPKSQPRNWNLKTMIRRIEKSGDLWKDFWERHQRLEVAVEQLEKIL